MNKLCFLLGSLILSAQLSFGQSQGISYQAVIIDQQDTEIPGVDVKGNYLPSKELTVRFTILNESGDPDYQEIHKTSTDEYGMINLIIGLGEPTGESPVIFTEIDWDGTPKDLLVEISLGEEPGAFLELSYQPLHFVPYAFHKNITATGTLTVDGKATFKGEAEFQDLTVMGTTNLNGELYVNNASPATLSGTVSIDGATRLQNTLTVEQLTTLNHDLIVNAPSGLNGQVTINADVNGADNNYNSYPLRVEGSNQGIGICIDGSRSSNNNFVTFWDSQGIQGRIEGQLTADVYNDPEYIFTNVLFGLKTIAQVANTATAIGASVVDPGNVAIETANAILLAGEIAEYEIFAFSNLGVSYQSGAGDYAEWLPRLDTTEQISPGQIVGVYGGKISLRTDDADMIMAISSTPIVLGNTPPKEEAQYYEKVGFMGQVPVWVLGPARKGDYIVAYKSGTGLGRAVPAHQLKPEMMQHILGRAWEDGHKEINLINTVIGFDTNEWAYFAKQNYDEITALRQEIDLLKEQARANNQVLRDLLPGYAQAIQNQKSDIHQPIEVVEDTKDEVVKRKFTHQQVVAIFDKSEQLLAENGYDVANHPFYSKINSDPQYKKLVIDEILNIYGN